MSSSSSLITTEEGCRQNMFAIESRPLAVDNYTNYASDAEIQNGRWAMIGFIAALGSYLLTGQIIPGVF